MRRESGIPILVCAILLGCSSGDSGSVNNGSTSRQILAKNVLLTPAHASLADKGTSRKDIDTTTTVMADDVIIDTSGNSLSSTNLQDALDKEMAIDLSKMLPGTTWIIINKTSDPTHRGLAGRVTFLDGTLRVDEGSFAAAGLRKDFEPFGCAAGPDTPISYEVNNSVMYASYNCDPSGNINNERSAVITVFARNQGTLSMVGDGGYGLQGVSKISILTKVQ